MSEESTRLRTLDAVKLARDVLSDHKAENITILDVGDVSSITDYFIIASGNNTRHLKALNDELGISLKTQGIRSYRSSGSPDSGWIVIDFIDFVVHVFAADVREHYDIEGLWKDAARVE